MRLQASERQVQVSVVQFLNRALPDDAVVYHPANGGHRHPAVAAKLKAEGVVSGVPDLALVWRGRAIFIELKARNGRLKKSQIEMHKRLVLAGAVVLPIARSIDEVADFLETLGMPLKGKLRRAA